MDPVPTRLPERDRFDMEMKLLEIRTAAGANAIRVPGIVNAAAIAVILSFLSNFEAEAAHKADLRTLIWSIVFFIIGVLASSLGAGFAYWNLVAEHDFYRSAYPAPGEDHVTFSPEADATRRRIGQFSIFMARVCVVASYLLFVIGSARMIAALRHLFGT